MVCGRERLKPHIRSSVSGLSPETLPREIRCPSCRSSSLAGLERICKASSAPAGMDTACPRALSRLSPQSAHCKSSGLMMKQREPSGSPSSLQPFADNKPAVTVVHRQSSRCRGGGRGGASSLLISSQHPSVLLEEWEAAPVGSQRWQVRHF